MLGKRLSEIAVAGLTAQPLPFGADWITSGKQRQLSELFPTTVSHLIE